jgi:hypothetical protein
MRRLTGCVEPWDVSGERELDGHASDDSLSPPTSGMKRTLSTAFSMRSGPRMNARCKDVRRAVLLSGARYRMPCLPTSLLVPSMNEIRTGVYKLAPVAHGRARSCVEHNGIGSMWSVDGACLWRTPHERSYFHAFTFLNRIGRGCKCGTTRLNAAWAESGGMATGLAMLRDASAVGSDCDSDVDGAMPGSRVKEAMRELEAAVRTIVIQPILEEDLKNLCEDDTADGADASSSSSSSSSRYGIVWDDEGHGSLVHTFAWTMDRVAHQCLIERDLVERFCRSQRHEMKNGKDDLELACRSMVLLAREMSSCRPHVNIFFCGSDADGAVRVIEDTHPEVTICARYLLL